MKWMKFYVLGKRNCRKLSLQFYFRFYTRVTIFHHCLSFPTVVLLKLLPNRPSDLRWATIVVVTQITVVKAINELQQYFACYQLAHYLLSRATNCTWAVLKCLFVRRLVLHLDRMLTFQSSCEPDYTELSRNETQCNSKSQPLSAFLTGKCIIHRLPYWVYIGSVAINLVTYLPFTKFFFSRLWGSTYLTNLLSH